MEKSDKYEGILQSILSPADAFVSAQEIMLVLMFLPYCIEHGALVTALLPIALLLPVATMPLVYSFLHRFDTLLFGRYHLIMPISAFIAAPFFILIFSASGTGAAAICKMFFGLLFFVQFSLIYKYCAFSVRARLYGEDVKRPTVAALCYFTVGAAATVACLFGFWHYDRGTAYINTAYVISSVQVLLSVAQYLTTFYGIPKLGGRRVQSVKSVYRLFYTGLNARTYSSSLLFTAAFMIQLLTTVSIAFAKTSAFVALGCAAATATAFVGVAWLASCFVKRCGVWLSAVEFVCVAVGAAACITLAFVDCGAIGNAALVIAAGVAAGGGLALALRQMRLRFLTVTRRVTSGTVYMLANVTVYAAAAIGTAGAAALALTGFTAIGIAAVYGSGLCVATAAFVTAQRATSAVEYIPAPSYELEYGESEREPAPDDQVNLPDEQDDRDKT